MKEPKRNLKESALMHVCPTQLRTALWVSRADGPCLTCLMISYTADVRRSFTVPHIRDEAARVDAERRAFVESSRLSPDFIRRAACARAENTTRTLPVLCTCTGARCACTEHTRDGGAPGKGGV